MLFRTRQKKLEAAKKEFFATYDDSEFKNDQNYGLTPKKPIMIVEPYGLNGAVRRSYLDSLLLEDGTDFTWELDRDHMNSGKKCNKLPGTTFKYDIKKDNKYLISLYINVKGEKNTDAIPKGFRRKEENNYEKIWIADEVVEDTIDIIETKPVEEETRSKLYNLFACAKKKIISTVSETPNDIEFEIQPFLYVIIDILLSRKLDSENRKKYATDLVEDITRSFDAEKCKCFNDRLDLYGAAVRGMNVRNDWSLGMMFKQKEQQADPLTRCLIVFGDILSNPECAVDYEGAPILLMGIDEVISFVNNIMKPVMDASAELIMQVTNLSDEINSI